ncbi:MAG: hypothetical protein ACBR15_04945 [Microcoleus sp.]
MPFPYRYYQNVRSTTTYNQIEYGRETALPSPDSGRKRHCRLLIRAGNGTAVS